MPLLRSLALAVFTLAGSPCSASAAQIQTADAARFAEVFQRHDGILDAAQLQREYLDAGTDALASMQPDYIVDASYLAAAISAQPAVYAHAISVCLPALQSAQDVVDEVARSYKVLFPSRQAPDIAFLFGSANSSGTVVDGRVVISLERACDGADSKQAFLARLRQLVAHEWIHTLQPALTDDDRRDLLVWALREGMANMLAAEIGNGDRSGQELAWATSREPALWQQFQTDRTTLLAHWPQGGNPDAVGEAAGTRWFWNTDTADGRPADLGYWIGQRIANAWYSLQADPGNAAHRLVESTDYDAILRESAYSPSP